MCLQSELRGAQKSGTAYPSEISLMKEKIQQKQQKIDKIIKKSLRVAFTSLKCTQKAV
jgi:transcription termination factor NusB